MHTYARVRMPMHTYAWREVHTYAGKCTRNMQGYARICMHMQQYAYRCTRMRTCECLHIICKDMGMHARICRNMHTDAGACGHVQGYAHVCIHVQGYSHMCIHIQGYGMRAYAGICAMQMEGYAYISKGMQTFAMYMERYARGRA